MYQKKYVAVVQSSLCGFILMFDKYLVKLMNEWENEFCEAKISHQKWEVMKKEFSLWC